MKFNKVSVFISVAGLMLSLGITGCSAWRSEPKAMEQDFGNSVRQMIKAQIADPNAALNPDPEPVKSLDGPKAGNVLDVYRKDVTKPEESKTVINIDLLGGSGR